ncbi:hypothetical protein ACFFKE_31940 [Streptomyces mutabilis]|uniref:hypothetical protein n=1 Tax=Streptomyces mutabilis TaxID=67332 RepID=UPI001780CAB8|nr:hypothetical protein [Streptomyces mutabilis]
MRDTQLKYDGRDKQETRARGTMAIWRWARWAALFLAVGWALNSVVRLVEGAQVLELWWPLLSTAIWAGVTVNGFVTYRRIRTTTLPAITGRPST